MNVNLIEMEPEEAREQLREYRRELHKRADAEYDAVASGLEALAKGRAILSLMEAIRGGGFDEQMRPRLAIARADQRQVRCTWRPNVTMVTFEPATGWRRSTEQQSRVVDLGRRHGLLRADGQPKWVQGYALVPLIPARIRKERGCGRSYDNRNWILFEVEQWADERIRAEPDRDPFLLRHLGGDAYAVLAAWDLTPLEQMVMAGRRSA
jgi:hypothetical protein